MISGIGLFDSPLIGSDVVTIDTYGLSLTVLSHLAGSKGVSARQPDPDAMTNSTVYNIHATASSTAKTNVLRAVKLCMFGRLGTLEMTSPIMR